MVGVLCLGLIGPAIAQEQAVVRTAPSRNGPERETVDPQDRIERFALLTVGGPLIVQVSLTIDGQPFRIGREKLLTEMIAAADADQDGQTIWTEALATTRFTFGRLGNLNEQLRESLSRTYDKNKNKVVEVAEARAFLAQFHGAAFSLGGGPASFRVVATGAVQPAVAEQADLLMLLDTDSSKSLDTKELAAAMARLKSRDTDDNDVLDANEVTGTPATGMYRVATFAGPRQPPPSGALLLGPTATASALLDALKQKYKNANGRLTAGCFPQFPELFAALDTDHSSEIDAREALGLNEVSPHMVLTVDLATQKAGRGLEIKSLNAEIHKAADGREKKELALPGVRISLAATISAPPARNYDSTAKGLLRQFDKDGNGYLEMSEYAVPTSGQFAMFDGNGDGKAFLDEIIAGYALQYAPQMTQVVANVVQQSNSLFQTLDANGDGRLGLREMQAAADRLAALDKDQDQIIGGNEIPEAFSVSFDLGSVGGPVAPRPVDPPTVGGRPAANAGPEWFKRMDRNGDGDVTLKEFLGSEADFTRLDTSGDGLLDPQEARAAGK